jgi:hypothetical protein
MENAIGNDASARTRTSITRQTVDLSGYPDLVVIYPIAARGSMFSAHRRLKLGHESSVPAAVNETELCW